MMMVRIVGSLKKQLVCHGTCNYIVILLKDTFATPCSTPPGSEMSETSHSRRVSNEEIPKNITNSINEINFHNQIYER